MNKEQIESRLKDVEIPLTIEEAANLKNIILIQWHEGVIQGIEMSDMYIEIVRRLIIDIQKLINSVDDSVELHELIEKIYENPNGVFYIEDEIYDLIDMVYNKIDSLPQ